MTPTLTPHPEPGITTPLAPATLEELRSIPLLAAMSDAELAWFSSLSPIEIGADTVLIRAGAASDAFWILLRGEVAVVESTASGPESILYIHQTGTTFGEVPLLANIPASLHPAHRLALTPSPP